MKTTTIIPENETKAEKFVRIATLALTVSLTNWTSSQTARGLPMSTMKNRLNQCLTQSATPLMRAIRSSSRSRRAKRSVSRSDCFT